MHEGNDIMRMNFNAHFTIVNYLHPTHVVYDRKGIRSKNAAPILFISTPGMGVL